MQITKLKWTIKSFMIIDNQPTEETTKQLDEKTAKEQIKMATIINGKEVSAKVKEQELRKK